MAPVSIKQAQRFLAVKTPLGPDKLVLTGFEGVEQMSRLFSFRLEMVSLDKAILAKDMLGQSVSVAVGPPDDQRWFNGIVRSWQLGGDFGRAYRTYYAELVPKLWLLTRKTNLRLFQQLSTSDILKKVITGLDVSWQLGVSYEKRNYCTQYRESDFDFVSRLMEEEGIFYYFKHSDGAHQLVVTDKKSSWFDCAETDVEYRTDLDVHSLVPFVSGWVPRFEYRSGKLTVRDQNFQKPSDNLQQSKTTLLEVTAFKDHELYDVNYGDYAILDGINKSGGEQAAELGKISTQTERLANAWMQAEEAEYENIDGQGTCRSFSPGGKFKLAKHVFTEQQNRDYVLTAVRHSASDLSHLPGEGGPPSYTNAFACITTDRQWRPARLTPRPRVQGPHTAFVVGPAGEEIFVDKYGRVKVQFTWDRDGKKDADSSCWLRVAQMWAGKQWGTIFIPRIGMEVIVDFLEGDPDRPIITGCVYNADFMPPYALPDNKTQSGIKTRSSMQGAAADFNELRFEDKKGSEDVYFHAQKDFHRFVENDDDLKVEHDQTIEVKNNRTETVKEGNETVTIKAGTRTHTVEKDETLTVNTGNRKVQVKTGNDEHLVDTGNRTVTVKTGNDELTIKTGNQKTTIGLGKQEVEAMQSIELKVGSSSIKIDQTGITIKGTLVKIEGTAMLEAKSPMSTVKGDGMLTLKGGLTMIN
jgi:type VI secretion system secreted protein VgrG